MVKLSRAVSDLPDIDIVPRSAAREAVHDPLPFEFGTGPDPALKEQIADEEAGPLPFTDDEDS